MDLVGVKGHLHFIASSKISARINPSNEALVSGLEVNKDFIPHQLGYVHQSLNQLLVYARRGVLWMVNIFRSNSKNNFPADMLLTHLFHLTLRNTHPDCTGVDIHFAQGSGDGTTEEVHRRRTNKAGHKDITGVIIQVLRRINLL